MEKIFVIKETDNINQITIDNSYSFFDSVVSFLAGICSTNLLIDSYLSEANPYYEGHYLSFEGRKKATNRIYYVFPFGIYKYIIDNKWPEELILHFKEKDFEDQEEIDGSITGFNKVFLSLGQATYIQFWENIKEPLIRLQSKDKTKWDELFIFGWIIRNALAHNFKVAINDTKFQNISWNNLSYDHTRNDVDISKEIMFLELIILMKDIEDRINKYSH